MQKNEFEFIVKFQVEKKVPNFFLDSDTFSQCQSKWVFFRKLFVIFGSFFGNTMRRQ